MSRLPRFILTGQPQHVIQRGNNRIPIFNSDSDKSFFREILIAACERYRCLVHAYVLMTNHVHFIMTPEQECSISKTMHVLGTRYVQYFNKRYHRTGGLWEGRYKAAIIDTEAWLLTCCRYIELNPVRANMVADPGDYPWSSYHANALGRMDALVVPHDVYLSLNDRRPERLSRYRALFNVPLNDGALDEIRQATQKGWALGGVKYKKEVERSSQRRSQPMPRGGYRLTKSKGSDPINRV